METPQEVYDRLAAAARGKFTARVASTTSVGAADAALRDLNFDLKRLKGLTEEQLLERALPKTDVTVPRPRG
jgi:hypothetical protein